MKKLLLWSAVALIVIGGIAGIAKLVISGLATRLQPTDVFFTFDRSAITE